MLTLLIRNRSDGGTDIDNEFPTIAQGLPKNAKKPTVKPVKHSKGKFNIK